MAAESVVSKQMKGLAMASSVFEQTVERAAGMPIDEVRNTPIDVHREAVEKKSGKRLTFVSYFPWIGRGNVLRDRGVTHEEAEAACNDAIRRLKPTV